MRKNKSIKSIYENKCNNISSLPPTRHVSHKALVLVFWWIGFRMANADFLMSLTVLCIKTSKQNINIGVKLIFDKTQMLKMLPYSHIINFDVKHMKQSVYDLYQISNRCNQGHQGYVKINHFLGKSKIIFMEYLVTIKIFVYTSKAFLQDVISRIKTSTTWIWFYFSISRIVTLITFLPCNPPLNIFSGWYTPTLWLYPHNYYAFNISFNRV